MRMYYYHILFSYVFMLRVQEQKSKTYNTALREVYILPVIRQLFIPENKMSTNNMPSTLIYDSKLKKNVKVQNVYGKKAKQLYKQLIIDEKQDPLTVLPDGLKYFLVAKDM